jgi:phage terminase large subunit
MNLQFNPRLFNPLYWHLKPLLRDPKIRFIFVEGGSSAAKTFSIAQALLVDQLEHNYSSLAFRRFNVHIKDTVYSSFKLAAASLDLKGTFYHFQDFLIKSTINAARIRFRGLDDEEAIKGIEDYDILYNNEWNQFIEDQFSQQRKRLRGRANQKIICDWNPVSALLWFYANWIDVDTWTDLPLDVPAPTAYSALNPEFAFKRINAAGDTVWIKVTYRDNYWIIGHPSGQGGFVDQATQNDFEKDRIRKPNLYRIYANGERGMIRTGGEFWKQFDETKHVKPLKVEEGALHISLDNNVNPYVTVSIWQLIDKNIRQVHELPCREPDNNAPKAAQRLAKWLFAQGYQDALFLYGDPSASARSTIDPNNASFFDKFIEGLKNAGFVVISRIARSAPEVALSGAFINDIYEFELDGFSITIGDHCKISIDDYISVKEDKDGRMLKLKEKDKATGVTFEPSGHFSDAKRYFIIRLLQAEFQAYKAKQKKYVIHSL